MPTNVSTTLVVTFAADGADDKGILQAEIDARPSGLNAGKTSFVPGDSVGILVYKGDDVSIDLVKSSAGAMAHLGVQAVEQTELIRFANVDTAQLSHPATGIVSTKWLGADGGAVTLSDQINLKLAAPVVGVLKVVYNTLPLGYRLSGVPHPLSGETEYEVLMYVQGSYA